ncbi:response regulator transcription factor [Paenibacillus sp. HN-1]|uniref:response regulator transcription factor n=1 Tax=Paenibacillus TaxID=44249 RepID=UPI001E0F9612|nr:MULTISPECIES: response regulator transcription factor [Paenibacillus]MBY9079343.1 response regulator transcription factor [Paenibacillus sp. CGMCC 1.18879]MBY9087722.1 response regulator transcription factor [Paenibacillus sinensis]
MTTVMVVDDDRHIRRLIRFYLEDEGLEVIEQANGLEAWEYYSNHPVDLIVLDVLMPNMDGWELCRRLREAGDKPVLMITAKGEPMDRIKGFQLGTDDYLVKPFEPMELVLRIKALLKRYKISVSETINLGSISLDKTSYQVRFRDTGEAESIPLKEFELLAALASYPGKLHTRDELIQRIWGYDYEGDERTVDTHIKRLRVRFGAYEQDFAIVTLRGLGYRLEVYRD